MASLTAQATTTLPTQFGEMRVFVYGTEHGRESLAIVAGTPDVGSAVPVRVHSACLTGEVLGSLKCDCKSQLDFALQHIAERSGVVVYLPQEGRGVGLANKVRAYALQEQGYDTIEANQALGLPVDARTYDDAAAILRDLGLLHIQLITNNPAKIRALRDLGIDVVGRVPIPLVVNAHSSGYLETKRIRMGHLFGPLCVVPPGAAAGGIRPPVADPAPPGRSPASRVIDRFRHPEGRPFVHANFALDESGRTTSGNGASDTLSCERDWRRVHELRERYCAVVVGARTWQIDRPRLTAREEHLERRPRRQPDRVIFAGRSACHVQQDGRRTFVVGSRPQPAGILHIETSEYGLGHPLAHLYRYGINCVLVEGGLTLLRSFVRTGMVDCLSVYVRTESLEMACFALRFALPELDAEEMQVRRFGRGVLMTIGNALIE
jgi:GTP cyclohydrolase II